MPTSLTPFEAEILHRLVATADAQTKGLLIRQEQFLRVVNRELTGVGFFVHLSVDREAEPVPRLPRIVLSGLKVEIEGLPYGAGFAAFVEDGYLSMLEGFTYGGDWPSDIGHYTFGYLDP